MAKTKADGRAIKAARQASNQAAELPDETYQAGTQVRVWWPPTTDKHKTDYAGMYWPVKVLSVEPEGLRVQYDNGEVETVLPENIHPLSPPVNFGDEAISLQVGEFVEVSNASETDPAAWLAKIFQINKNSFTVQYPFHDTPNEVIKPQNIRRARLFEKETQQWKIIKPNQDWDDGEVESPLELETIDGRELAKLLQPRTPAESSSTSMTQLSDLPQTKKRPRKAEQKSQADTAGSSKRKGNPVRARS